MQFLSCNQARPSSVVRQVTVSEDWSDESMNHGAKKSTELGATRQRGKKLLNTTAVESLQGSALRRLIKYYNE
jgi:hypothetical protein